MCDKCTTIRRKFAALVDELQTLEMSAAGARRALVAEAVKAEMREARLPEELMTVGQIWGDFGVALCRMMKPGE